MCRFPLFLLFRLAVLLTLLHHYPVPLYPKVLFSSRTYISLPLFPFPSRCFIPFIPLLDSHTHVCTTSPFPWLQYLLYYPAHSYKTDKFPPLPCAQLQFLLYYHTYTCTKSLLYYTTDFLFYLFPFLYYSFFFFFFFTFILLSWFLSFYTIPLLLLTCLYITS